MTTDHRRVDAELVQEVLLCERVVQQILEAVMTEQIGGAAPYDRLEGRTGHRNGHKPRMLYRSGLLMS
jgi:transposase-like protein